jgi:hypothetical protein
MIPGEIIKNLEKELDGLLFGSVGLTVRVHDGHARYEVTRSVSIDPDKAMSGSKSQQDRKNS